VLTAVWISRRRDYWRDGRSSTHGVKSDCLLKGAPDSPLFGDRSGFFTGGNTVDAPMGIEVVMKQATH